MERTGTTACTPLTFEYSGEYQKWENFYKVQGMGYNSFKYILMLKQVIVRINQTQFTE
jgi:hypothetical protein